METRSHPHAAGREVALDLSPGGWALVVAPHAAADLMLDLAARLAQRGPVRILDGGNRFRAHGVARALARWARTGAGRPDLGRALGHIQLARAFTCYQMLALLEQTPAETAPVLVLDLLATFYDESVPLVESQRLLESCLGQVSRLSRRAPLAVSARLPDLEGPHPEGPPPAGPPPAGPPPAGPPPGGPPPGGPRASLLARLEKAADHVWRLERQRPPSPARLF